MTGVLDRPIFFEAGIESLAGVVTEPILSNGLAVIMAWGAGVYPSSGRNQFRMRLSHEAAEAGYVSLRFDYRGVGESDGVYRYPSLSAPYTDEIVAAASWLVAHGAQGVLVVGNCFGAWSALMAVDQIPLLAGVAVINSPVGSGHIRKTGAERSAAWWLKRIKAMKVSKVRQRSRRKLYTELLTGKLMSIVGMSGQSNRFIDAVDYLLKSEIPLLLLYGQSDFRADIETELEKGLSRALDEAGPDSRAVLLSERLSGYSTLVIQDLVVSEVMTWLKEFAVTRIKDP